jgi:hypothetical protein
MIVLYCNYYKSIDRQHEIDICLYHNLKNKSIDKLVILYTGDIDDINKLNDTKKLFILINIDSPTYYEMIEIINNNSNDNDINIFCNSDIIIDEESILLCNKYLKKNICYCLTRFDLSIDINNNTTYNDMYNNCKIYNTTGSFDTFIFIGKILNIENKFNYLFGSIHCDTRYAYDISSLNYKTINPCYDIYTYHLHLNRKPYLRGNVLNGGGNKNINFSRLIPLNLPILIKTNSMKKILIILNSIKNTFYDDKIYVYTKSKRIKNLKKKFKFKITNKKLNILRIKHKIIFKNPFWYKYYLINKCKYINKNYI